MNMLFKKSMDNSGGGGGGSKGLGKRAPPRKAKPGVRRSGGLQAPPMDDHYGFRTHIFLSPTYNSDNDGFLRTSPISGGIDGGFDVGRRGSGFGSMDLRKTSVKPEYFDPEVSPSCEV